MTIQERKEREKEDKRNLILNTADEIVKTEGIHNLSIRKIAGRMDYSPAIIYHYFRDKEDILNQLMRKNYQQIIEVLSSAQQSAGSPVEKIHDMFRKYIDLALNMPDAYKTIMLNNTPGVLEHTSVLFRGSSKKRPAINILCQCLKELHPDIEDSMLELTAQVLWSAAFGLIIRLITEQNSDEEHRTNLIEHHIRMLLAWIKENSFYTKV